MRALGVLGGVGRALGVVSTVLGGGMLSAGAASGDGPVHVRSRLGDACLDAPSWIGDVPVVINPCNDSDFQRWNLNGRQLENVAFPGKCLTEQQKYSVVHLEMCRGAMVQNWNFQPNGQVTNDLGNCLTALGGPGPGTRASARWCSGDPGQGWDIAP
jgi:Ricin-type beta-trefoil lectin domain